MQVARAYTLASVAGAKPLTPLDREDRCPGASVLPLGRGTLAAMTSCGSDDRRER